VDRKRGTCAGWDTPLLALIGLLVLLLLLLLLWWYWNFAPKPEHPPEQPKVCPQCPTCPACEPRVVHQVTLDAATYFDFNLATLRPEGKLLIEKRLRPLIEQIVVQTITITGHTDPIGAPEYNLRLSADRAAAVKELIDQRIKGGIRLIVQAKGETEPLPGFLEVCGALPREVDRKRCFQPLRRVEVQIEGIDPSGRRN
jgi:outer membrane protein OmpA-like peptidoglycan-associated protein